MKSLSHNHTLLHIVVLYIPHQIILKTLTVEFRRHSVIHNSSDSTMDFKNLPLYTHEINAVPNTTQILESSTWPQTLTSAIESS